MDPYAAGSSRGSRGDASPSPSCRAASSSRGDVGASGSASQPPPQRRRFFPPPFRVDYAETPAPGDPLPHAPTPEPPRQRRLLFTSELGPPPAANPDGTPNVEHLRYASTLRLKARWDDIFERFRDAHLVDQDEIDLGRPGPDDKGPRLVRDKGLLRALPQKRLDFGSFIKEEDLVFEGETPGSTSALAMGAEEAGAARWAPEDSDDDEGEEGGGWAANEQLLSQYPEFQRGPSAPWQGTPLYEPVQVGTNDDDLREFLDAEARRRTIVGNDSADEEDVVDFEDPQWHRGGAPPRRPRGAMSPDAEAAEAALGYSSSEDACDIVMTAAELDEYYREDMIARRENVEDDFFFTPINTILPYDDVPGLAELLDLPPPRRKRGRPRKHALLPDDFSSAAKRGKKSVCGGPVMIRLDPLTGLPTPPRSGPDESCGDTSASSAHPAGADASGSLSLGGAEPSALRPKPRPRKSVAKSRVADPNHKFDEEAVVDLLLERELMGGAAVSPRQTAGAKRVRKSGSSSKRKSADAAQGTDALSGTAPGNAAADASAPASTSLDAAAGAEPAASRPKKRSRPRRSEGWDADAEPDPNAPPKRRPGRPKGSKDKKPRRLAAPRTKPRAAAGAAATASEAAATASGAAATTSGAAATGDMAVAIEAVALSPRKSVGPAAAEAASTAPVAPAARTTPPRIPDECGGDGGGCSKSFCLRCGGTFSSPIAAVAP